MAERPIVIHPDPVLRRICDPVAAFDAALAALAVDMLDTMYAAPGRGLAAPQVGQSLRLFVMDTGWKDGAAEPQVFVNPRITWRSGVLALHEEGCLSIPGRTTQVARPDAVELVWRDVTGMPQAGRFAGIAAICVQHEIDHLDGVLCIDNPAPAGGDAQTPEAPRP